jgi:hypothetical protein
MRTRNSAGRAQKSFLSSKSRRLELVNECASR